MKDIVLKTVPVAGSEHIEDFVEQCEDSELMVELGDHCVLRRESNNPHDKNAISVWAMDLQGDVHRIGWVPKRANPILAKLMDGGLQLHAQICRAGKYNYEIMGAWWWVDIIWRRDLTTDEKAQEVIKEHKGK